MCIRDRGQRAPHQKALPRDHPGQMGQNGPQLRAQQLLIHHQTRSVPFGAGADRAVLRLPRKQASAGQGAASGLIGQRLLRIGEDVYKRQE